MKEKLSFRKFGIVFVMVALLSLLASVTVYAQDGEPIVEIFRRGGTYVEIKITFPTDISGSFTGMIAGKSFDCTTIPPNVVYCSGPFQKGAGTSTLFLINQDTNETIIKKVVTSPRPKNEKPPEEPATEEPPECVGSAIVNPCGQ